MKKSRDLAARGLGPVTGSTVANKPFNIVIHPFPVVSLLDQPFSLSLAWVGRSNTIVGSCDQVYTD